MNKAEIILCNFHDFIQGKEIKSFTSKVQCVPNQNGYKYFHLISKTFQNDFYNHHYTENQFITYLFLVYLAKGAIGLYKLNHSEVKKQLRSISKNHYNKDMILLREVVEKNKIDFNELFSIGEDGESLIFKLVRKGFIGISPVIFNYKKLLTSDVEYVIIINDEYQRFLDVLKKLFHFIKRSTK